MEMASRIMVFSAPIKAITVLNRNRQNGYPKMALPLPHINLAKARVKLL